VQGSCATTTAHGRSPLTCRAPLVFTCLAHFPLRIRSKTFLNSDRASFFLLVWFVLCCLWRVWDLATVFYYTDTFNQDIGRWDVSAVTNMEFSECLPSLASLIPRRECVCKGRVSRRPADGLSPFTCRAPLVFTCLAHFPLRIRSKTFLNSDRASFFLLVWCFLCCLWRVLGPAQCSILRVRSTKTLAAGTCLQ
jgi:hypothetical protein